MNMSPETMITIILTVIIVAAFASLAGSIFK